MSESRVAGGCRRRGDLTPRHSLSPGTHTEAPTQPQPHRGAVSSTLSNVTIGIAVAVCCVFFIETATQLALMILCVSSLAFMLAVGLLRLIPLKYPLAALVMYMPTGLRLRAALVAEVVVPALPRPVPEEGEAAREEERVGPRLAPPRQPLALRGHRQVRSGPEQRRPTRRGRTEDALARLAVVDLNVSVEVKSLL